MSKTYLDLLGELDQIAAINLISIFICLLVIESQSSESLIDSYQSACEKQNIRPIPRVLQQLKVR